MRQEKQLLLSEVKGQIENYGSFVIMRYGSMGANKFNEFRRQIATIGGNVEVMRKRILIKAAKEAGVEIDLETLPGHIGLVYAGSDPFEMTKFVFKFGQENDKALQVVGGRFEGQVYNAAQVEMLSKLPGKDEMRAQLLSVFEAPMAQTLAVVEALLSSVVYCLDNKCKKDHDGSDQ